MRSYLVNAVDTALAEPVSGADATIRVTDPTGLPPTPFYLVVDPFSDIAREYMLANAVNDDVLTVTRNLAGTESTNHDAGDLVRITYMAQHLDDLWDEAESHLPLSGGIMQGDLDMAQNFLYGLANPTNPDDATHKAYVDGLVDAIPPPIVEHDELLGVETDQHHARYTDSEAIEAVDTDEHTISIDTPTDPSEGDVWVNPSASGGTDTNFLPITGGDLRGGQTLDAGLVRNFIVSFAEPASPLLGDFWFNPGSETRDPVLWPYPPGSFWNMPLGADAVLVDAELTIPSDKTVGPEEDTLILSPQSPLIDLMKHDGDWAVTPPIRCDQRTGEVLRAGLPIPTTWHTDPDYYGDRPNMSSAILLPDNTLYESQPFHICVDGVPVSQYHNDDWGEGPGSSIVTGGMADGDDHGGSHGGARMTAYGGTIRLGEWVVGSTIRHALKLIVSSYENLYGDGAVGYRWPANAHDAKWPGSYNGTVPEFLMGALLCLPQSFDVDALRTEPARIIANAMRTYGGYVVDSSGYSSIMQYTVERGPQGRVMDEFEAAWGYPMDGRKWNAEAGTEFYYYLDDMEIIYASFYVVDDNAVDNVGGAGARVGPMAPEFGSTGEGGLKVWDGTGWIG